MRQRQTLIIYAKEMRDALRDRRTLITMLVVPVAMYPLLLVGSVQLLRHYERSLQKEPLTIGVVGTLAEHANDPLLELLRREDRVRLQELASATARSELEHDRVDAVLHLPLALGERLERLEPSEIVIEFDETEGRSRKAEELAREHTVQLGRTALGDRLVQLGFDRDAVEPLVLKADNIASAEKMGAYMLGSLFTYMLLFITILGAYYPAIDLGAGERERGTLETLIVTPVRRSEIAVGKFLAVFTFACATALVNLLSLGVTFRYALDVGSRQRALAALELRLDADFLILLPLMIAPFAALFSALMLLVSVFARSFKEAQTYLSPILLVVLLPIMAGMLPGNHLTLGAAIVPVLNLVLLFKDLMLDKASAGLIALVLMSNTLYAGLLLGLAVRAYEREGLLDGSPSLIAGLRRLWRNR